MKCHILIFLKIRKDVTKCVACCRRELCFKGNNILDGMIFVQPKNDDIFLSSA